MCFHLKIKQTAHLFAQTTTNVPSVCFFCYDMRSLCRLFQIFIHLWTKHIILSLISRIRTRVFKRVASLSKLKLRSERSHSSPYKHHCNWSVQRPRERILWRTWITPQERRKPNKEKSLDFLLKYEPNIGVVLAGFAGSLIFTLSAIIFTGHVARVLRRGNFYVFTKAPILWSDMAVKTCVQCSHLKNSSDSSFCSV